MVAKLGGPSQIKKGQARERNNLILSQETLMGIRISGKNNKLILH